LRHLPKFAFGRVGALEAKLWEHTGLKAFRPVNRERDTPA